MTRHKIDIEGLPEGWEPVKLQIGYAVGIVEPSSAVGACLSAGLIVRRKVRKYDWSKTLDDVLVTSLAEDDTLMLQNKHCGSVCRIAEVWQPNIHGKCPVDPHASMVRWRDLDGEEFECIASCINWESVTAWKFICLAYGWEW